MAAGPVDAVGAAPRWEAAFDLVRSELHREFDGNVPRETVDRCFVAELARFHDARITAFLHILLHRNTRARLNAIQVRSLRAQG
jgi:hypothetical protein